MQCVWVVGVHLSPKVEVAYTHTRTCTNVHGHTHALSHTHYTQQVKSLELQLKEATMLAQDEGDKVLRAACSHAALSGLSSWALDIASMLLTPMPGAGVCVCVCACVRVGGLATLLLVGCYSALTLLYADH